MANSNINSTIGSLRATDFSLPVAGVYSINGTLELPDLQEGAPADSQVVSVVKQNGSTKYTSAAGDRGFHIALLCAANDVITIDLSSAAAVDNLPNAIKCTVSIG